MSGADSLADLFEIKLEPDEKNKKPKPRQIILDRNDEVVDYAADEADLDEDAKQGLFVYDAMRKAYDPLTRTIRENTLDTGDLPLAKNFHDFCTNIIGSKVKPPFIRQYWIAFKFFSEFCPHCSTAKFNDITNYEVDDPPDSILESCQLLENGVCPKCDATKSMLVRAGELADYNELVLVLGQRSGKSTLSSLMSGYLVHRLLKIPRLSTICRGIQDFTPIQGTFVGLTFNRALKLLWAPFSSIIERSDWFVEYHKLLDHHGNFLGKELYRSNSMFLRYNVQNLEFYPSGPMKRTLRGDTRMLACLSGKTRILTNEGWRSIKDDLTGLKVEVNGEYHDVIRHIPRGIKETYRLTLDNGLILDGTLDHKIRVYSVEANELQWIQIGDLTEDHQVVCDLGTQSLNIKRKELSEGHSSKERGYRFPSILAFLNAAFKQNRLFTNEDMILQTGATEGIVENLNTRLRRAGYIERAGGKRDNCILLKMVKPIPSVKELRKAPKGIHTRKWDQSLPTQTSDELAGILGYLMADGDLKRNLKFDSLSEEKTEHFSDLWEKTFGVKLFDQHDARYTGTKEVRLWFGSKRTTDFFNNNGLPIGKGKGPTAHTKKLPGFIFEGTASEQRACIDAYISCDGSTGRHNRVSFWTASYGLAIGMQILLAGLGFKSFRVFCYGGGLKNEGWKVSLSNIDSVRFLDSYQGLNKREGQPDTHAKSLVKSSPKERTQEAAYSEEHLLYGTNTYLSRVQSVERKGLEEVFDISVDSKEHAFNANGIRARNCIDELGWFPFDVNKKDDDMEDEERERADADEVHASLSNSLSTIRTEIWNLYEKDINHVPQAVMMNMSSPSSWKDKICRLLKDSEGSKYSLGIRMATWDINPIFTRDHPVIVEQYRKNPIKADRDFGANPPSLSSTIYDKASVQMLFTGRHHHLVVPEHVDSIVKGEEKRVYGRLAIKYHRAVWPSAILALDAGLSNNSFSIVLAFLQDQVMVVASIIEIIPTQGRKIDFPKVAKFIIHPLIETCNVHFVFADRWNSVMVLQQIPDKFPKCKAAQVTLKPKNFNAFNSDFMDTGNLVLPELELPTEQIETVRDFRKDLINCPSSHLYLQFLTVREMQGVIMKGDGYTDDTYRALVLAGTMIRDPKVKEHLDKFTPRERRLGDFSSKIIVSGRTGIDFSKMQR